MAAAAYFDTVQKIFIAFYQRPADPAGLKYWADRIDAANGDAAAVVSAFATSPEAVTLYGPIDATTIGTVIDKIYLALFNTTPDAAGKKFYVDGFTAGTFTAGTIALNILNGATNDDAVAIANKLQVSNSFTQQVDGRALTSPYFGTGSSFNATYKGDADAQAARDILKTVTASPSTVLSPSQVTVEIQTKIADAGDPIVGQTSGQTFTLTSSVDNVAGTSGNDTIVAGTQATNPTLNAGDQINGGAGIDTLQLYGNANATAFNGAAISNVEVVAALFDATAGALNVAGNSGVTSVNVGNSTVTNAAGTGAITVTLAKAQAAGITGTILNDTTTNAAGNNANVTFAFSDVTGGADSATLNVNNAKFAKNSANVLGAGSGVTIAGVETLNIAATGANALGNLLIADTTKLVITGAGSLSATLSQAAGLTKTIDGSAATGNLTIDNKAAAAAVESIKTGSGNDVYTTQFLNLTKDDVIDLGTGTDSLRFSDAATINSTASAAALAKVTGVEQLGTVGTALTIDGDFVSQTSYYTSGVGSVVLSNIASNADVTLATGVIGASSVGMKLGANTLNVNLTGSTAAADATAGLTVTGSATVNVKSSGVDGVANNVLNLTAADNQSVVVTGSQNLTLTATAATGTTGFSIDGSAFTGKLTVTGTAATDIVKGGSGNDTISGGAGAVSDTLTGGAGADTFVLTTGLTGIIATGAEVITDFVTKSDILKVGIAGSATTYTEATTAVADFTAALAAANAALAGVGGVQINAQQVGSDVWVFVDSNDSGAINAGDVIVKLVGVALTGIEAGDFIV